MTIGSIDTMVAAPAAAVNEARASAKGQKQDLFMAMFAALLGTAEPMPLQMPSAEVIAVTIEAAAAPGPTLPMAPLFGAQADIQWSAPLSPDPKPAAPAAPAAGAATPAASTPAHTFGMTAQPAILSGQVAVKTVPHDAKADIQDTATATATAETEALAPVSDLPQPLAVQVETAPHEEPLSEDAADIVAVEKPRQEASQQVQSALPVLERQAVTEEKVVRSEGFPSEDVAAERSATIPGQPERPSPKPNVGATKETVVTAEKPVEAKKVTPSGRSEMVEAQQLKPRMIRTEPARTERLDLKEVGNAGDARRREVISQMMTAMRGAQLRNQSEVRVRLEPQELGEVWVKVTSQAGTLSADFKVTTDFARAAIAEKLPDLKQALIDSGLKVSTMTCDMGQAFDDGRGRSRERPERRPVYQNLRREVEAASRPSIQVRGIASNRLDMIA